MMSNDPVGPDDGKEKKIPNLTLARRAISGLSPKDAQGTTTGGVFISPESLNFPAAAAICASLVGSVNVFVGGAAHSVWLALGVSVLVGAIIVLVGWPSNGSQLREKVVYALTGVLNILLLFASVMGITAMATQMVPGVVP